MRISWTEPALQDAEEIRAFIGKDSDIYAVRVLEQIFETVENLNEHPRLGRVVPEFGNEAIREIFVFNYRIIYNIQNDIITVLTIVHSARDLKSL